jgi:hypothetical protein
MGTGRAHGGHLRLFTVDDETHWRSRPVLRPEDFVLHEAAIASFAWDLDRIPTLLIGLSESMGDEVTWLTELDSIGAAAAFVV